MKIFKRAVRALLFAAVVGLTGVAHAAPVVCSAGNTDSTCMDAAAISAPMQAPPTGACSGPGESVATAPRWTGSSWTAASCNYTPPPTCPDGTIQQSAPTWDGSAWGGLSCVPSWPAGFAPDGNAYAVFAKYCGLLTEPSYDFYAGKPYPKSMACTTSFAGASRATSPDGFGYWNTPASVTLVSTGFTGWGISPNLATPGLELSGNNWVAMPGANPYPGVIPSGGVLVFGTTGAVGFGESEVFVYGCPAAYPILDLNSFSANADSNPLVVECTQ
jgi:hypothetical protein